MRHGTFSLFAALNVATGGGIGRFRARVTGREFTAFLAEVDGAAEPGPIFTPSPTTSRRTKRRGPPMASSLTPDSTCIHLTHASWLNLVERFFDRLRRKPPTWLARQRNTASARSSSTPGPQRRSSLPLTKTADHVLAFFDRRFANPHLEAHKAE